MAVRHHEHQSGQQRSAHGNTARADRRRLPIMVKTTTPPDTTLRWYLRSLGDHDTHRGQMGTDGSVLAVCGASFAPRLTLLVVGPPPGQLVNGPPALLGYPKEPDQICLHCQHDRTDR